MKKKAVSGIVVTLFLLSVLGIAFNSTPVAGQISYDVNVSAWYDYDGPLNVSIYWENDTMSGSDYTNDGFGFNLIGQTAELNLSAPLTWVEDDMFGMPTFWVFYEWYVENGTGSFDFYTNDITLYGPGDAWTYAIYLPVLSVDKELTDAFLTPNHSHPSADIASDQVPLGTKVYFNMTITVHAYEDVTDVVVKDGIGADLVLYEHDPIAGVDDAKAGNGKMGATKVTWTIGSIALGADKTLELDVYTGMNSPGGPKKQAPQYQEYTSLGDHDLNSGPIVYFTYDGTQYMLQGPPVTVTVVEVL